MRNFFKQSSPLKSNKEQTKKAVEQHNFKKDTYVENTRNFFDKQKLYMKSAIDYQMKHHSKGNKNNQTGSSSYI